MRRLFGHFFYPLTLCILSISPSWSGEVDAFTNRKLPEHDSAIDINRITTMLIRGALDEYNKAPPGECDPDLLKETVRIMLDTNFSNAVREFSVNSDPKLGAINAQYIKHTDPQHLYYGVRGRLYPMGAFALRLADLSEEQLKDLSQLKYAMDIACCSPNINLNKHYVGLDKIGHFFENGFGLYRDSNGDIHKAFKINKIQEEGTWGLWFTGVKSYADMAANYDGMRFYQWLLDGPDAAIQCHHGKYYLDQEIHIENYVTDAWDEGMNCSDFTEELAETVVPRILDRTQGRGCPIHLQTCALLRFQYPEKVAREILHPRCFDAEKILRQEAQHPSLISCQEQEGRIPTHWTDPSWGIWHWIQGFRSFLYKP